MKFTLLFINTDTPFSQYEKYLPHVHHNRLEKIEKHKSQKDKTLLLFSHLLARHRISQDLNISFNDVKLFSMEKGKPYIERNNYHFSISHHENCVAFVSHHLPVGIDTQKISSRITPAINFFTDEEKEYVNNSCEKFTQIWTQKEAYVKMLGTGLGEGFKTFSVLKELKNSIYTEKISDYIVSICAENIHNITKEIITVE